jgi:hypothetical protein
VELDKIDKFRRQSLSDISICPPVGSCSSGSSSSDNHEQKSTKSSAPVSPQSMY